MKKNMLVLCLFVILFFLINNLYKKMIETFSSVKNLHNCPPFSVTHKPFNSFNTISKGWCTENSYDSDNNSDYDDFSGFEKSPVKCQPNYSRVKPLNSHKGISKAYCKIADT